LEASGIGCSADAECTIAAFSYGISGIKNMKPSSITALQIALAISPAWASDLPNPSLTPGTTDPNITQQNIHSTVCVKGYTKTVRPPASYTNKLKKRQMRQYGYSDLNTKDYEEDHLIPLGIGGNPSDQDNLWPQPRNSEWNAAKKDELEFMLYRMVCKNEIPLKEAQAAIASNWIEAYKKYVNGNWRHYGHGHVD
jgi:hypothetical protein